MPTRNAIMVRIATAIPAMAATRRRAYSFRVCSLLTDTLQENDPVAASRRLGSEPPDLAGDCASRWSDTSSQEIFPANGAVVTEPGDRLQRIERAFASAFGERAHIVMHRRSAHLANLTPYEVG